MFPKGGMQGLLKQAKDMQKKMKKLDEDLLELRIKGSASGKLVEVEANGKKDILSDEQPVIDFAYACVVTISNVSQGEKFTMDNLWVKRPGTGSILAKEFENILGKEATEDIPKDTQLSKAMFK